MKITKYLHSCLVVEDNGKVAIIDPDMFTYQEKLLDVSFLKSLDYILITHKHFDHMSAPLIKTILKKFPKAKVIGNQEIADELQKKNITVQTHGNDDIVMIPVQHERIFNAKQEDMDANTQFDVFGKLSHPGDSLSSKDVKDVFALPIEAPWGSTTWAVETALKLQPKIVIPIHDYLWKDQVREMFYPRVAEIFKQNNIDFYGLSPGESVDI